MIVVIILHLKLHTRFACRIQESNPYHVGTKVLTFLFSCNLYIYLETEVLDRFRYRLNLSMIKEPQTSLHQIHLWCKIFIGPVPGVAKKFIILVPAGSSSGRTTGRSFRSSNTRRSDAGYSRSWRPRSPFTTLPTASASTCSTSPSQR